MGVLLGKGDGTFQTALSYDSAYRSPDSVAIADVNGDGKPDLIVGNLYSDGNYSRGSVDVLLGLGNGTFQPPVTLDSGGEYAYSVAATDVNGDGRTDLIVANYCVDSICATGGVAVFLGNGNGTFQLPLGYSTAAQATESVIVTDVNGDGKPDIVAASLCGAGACKDGAVSLLLGNGDGTFRPALSYDSGGYYSVSVATSDVNADGKADVLVTSQCDNANGCADGIVAVMLGNGDGTFHGAEMFMPGGSWAYAVAIGDLNGDGKPDLVVADQLPNGGGGSLGILLSDGDGTFQKALTYASGGPYVYSVAISDVNGDGKPDLVVADYTAGVGVLVGKGDGTFQPVVTYNSGGNYSYSILAADVNHDGKPDLLVANGCVTPTNCPNGGVGVLLGNGNGTFRPAVTYSSGGQNAYSVAVADLNGDGNSDLVVVNEYASATSSNGSIGVLLGNGDGTFQNEVSYNSGGYQANAASVGDVNGDGKPDLLVSNACVNGGQCGNGIIGVLLGNGDGTFQPLETVITPPMGLGALVIADLNGDGRLDVASGIGDFLLLGNGDGTFQIPFQLGAGGSGIAVGDLNGDGRPDLAVGGVAILLNISPATKLSTTTTLGSSQNPSVFGQSTTFTATIQGTGAPTGAVTFRDGTAQLGTSNVTAGSAGMTVSNLSTGTHSITASYSGDSNFLPSTSAALTQSVSKASTTTSIVSSANPSYLNQSVTFKASVKSQDGGAVTGTVAFKQGTTVLGTAVLTNGQAAYSTTYTTTGTRSITATYSGDSNNFGSTSAVLYQAVNALPAATTTKIATSGSPTYINQPVTFTATITSTYGAIPDGETVTFYDGATVIGTGVTANGLGTFSTSALAARSHTIKATYAGDATFKSSSGTVTQVVNLYPSSTSVPTSSLNPSIYEQAVTLRTIVSSSAPSGPTGTVVFKNGTTWLASGTVGSTGLVTVTMRTLPAGSLSITATYNGDSETAKSTSAALTQTVTQATSATTVKSSLNPSLSGQTVTFTAIVTSPTTTPTGTVTFMDGSTILGTGTLSGGKTTYTTATLSSGTHNVSAIYGGTSNIKGSTAATLLQNVN